MRSDSRSTMCEFIPYPSHKLKLRLRRATSWGSVVSSSPSSSELALSQHPMGGSSYFLCWLSSSSLPVFVGRKFVNVHVDMWRTSESRIRTAQRSELNLLPVSKRGISTLATQKNKKWKHPHVVSIRDPWYQLIFCRIFKKCEDSSSKNSKASECCFIQGGEIISEVKLFREYKRGVSRYNMIVILIKWSFVTSARTWCSFVSEM